MISNKYFSFAFFTTFGIKASQAQTGKINIAVDGKNITIDHLGVSKTGDKDGILQNIQKDIQKQIPFYLSRNYFISELKLNGAGVDISDWNNIKIEENKKADIVLKKKLKLKEIKFNDSSFKQDLLNSIKDEIKDVIEDNVDLTYKTIFKEIKKIDDLFKINQFGIKLNNFEDTNEKPYSGDDKLNEGDEITVILDEKKIEENAFSKFIVTGDKNIIDIYWVKEMLETNYKNIKNNKINEIFEDIFSNTSDVYKNDDKNSIKTDSAEEIPKDLKYFIVNVIKENLNLDNNNYLKCNCILKFSKKGCKLIDENVLKSIEYIFKDKSWNETDKLIEFLKGSCFINEDIDENMISVKNQVESDTTEYNKSTDKIPAKIIIDLSPEAFIANQVKVVFEIKDVEKDGRKLKGDFKNKFKGKLLTLNYGEKKLNFINQLNKIIPGITESDINLNGQPLPNDIKEGGVISIPVEKIPDENFEDKAKPEEEDKEKGTGEKGSGSGNGDENNNKKKNGYCGSNNK